MSVFIRKPITWKPMGKSSERPEKGLPYRFNAQERAVRAGMRGVASGPCWAWMISQRRFAAGVTPICSSRNILMPRFPSLSPDYVPISTAGQQSPRCPRTAASPGYARLPPVYAFCRDHNLHPESARFRDNVIGLAATKISAG